MGEGHRLAAVARYNILDTPPDGTFDLIAQLAARLFDTPIATVSIVDSDRIWFKATHGLDGVTQIDRELGLCASAILQDGMYLITDALTDPRTDANSLVHGDMGIQFYAGAPIVTTDGYRLGTVNVLDTRAREVTAEQQAGLRDLARLVADQLEVRLSALATVRQERELREQAELDRATIQRFASTLQRTLLPPTLPLVPDLELTCFYRAASAEEVLGDFYDVFAVGSDRWAFFIGDVEGHGPDAAAMTSLVRYTLRAAALHQDDLAACLEELNEAILGYQTPRLCTVMLGVLDPHPDTGFAVTLASGGHPPAMRLRANGTLEKIKPAGGMLVGGLVDASFATCQLHLQAGETLLLYTDGLTEARPGGKFFEEDGLAAFLTDREGMTASTLISALSDLIATFDPAPTDDIALLAMGIANDLFESSRSDSGLLRTTGLS